MARGKSTLSYMGVVAPTPPDFTTHGRAPTPNDRINHSLGDMWLHYKATGATVVVNDVYILVGLVNNRAKWIRSMYWENIPGVGVVQSGVAGNVFADNGLDGQVLIGGAPTPAWVNITSVGGTIAIVDGPNLINIEATGVAGLVQLGADVGIAAPVAGQINILGGSNMHTDAPVPGANDLTVNLDDDVVIPVTGSLTLSSFAAGVVQSDAAGLLFADNGANGTVLIGGGAAPAWRTLTAGANITINETPNAIEIVSTAGGGGVVPAATCAFQAYMVGDRVNVTGDGTSYKVLYNGIDFNTGGNYNNVTGEFVAPRDGYYSFDATVYLFNLDTTLSTNMQFHLCVNTPTTRSYSSEVLNPRYIIVTWGVPYYISGQMHEFLYLTAGESVYVVVEVGGHTLTVGVQGWTTGRAWQTVFSGFLVGV